VTVDGSLGSLIAVGRTSEVFRYGDDRVVKLLRRGSAGSDAELEASRATAASLAGAPAPAVHGVIAIDGRHGIVFDRLDGDSLLDEIALDPMRVGSWARQFADLHHSVLSTTPPGLPSVRDVMAERIERADITTQQRAAALSVLKAAPEGDSLLHGDFRPGNVILSAAGAQVIDWANACTGPPSADIARTVWLISVGTPGGDGVNRRVLSALQRMFLRGYQRRITSRSRIDRRVISAWRLPIVASRLGEGSDTEEVAVRTELARLTGT
jgi:aminoglycoside phosphotransferase (APT) family kinase protein